MILATVALCIAVLADSVVGITESCHFITSSSTRITCPRLHHFFWKQLYTSNVANCQSGCYSANDKCHFTGCFVNGTLSHICDIGRSGSNCNYVKMGCREWSWDGANGEGDDLVPYCALDDRAGCRYHDFQRTNVISFSSSVQTATDAALWATSSAQNWHLDAGGTWFFVAASEDNLNNSWNSFTPAITAPFDYGPLLVHNTFFVDTSLSTAGCWGEGMILQVPGSKTARSFTMSFHFYVPSWTRTVQSSGGLFKGRFGVTFHYESPTSYYLWSFGCAGGSGSCGSQSCSGIFKRDGDNFITIAAFADSNIVTRVNEWYAARLQVVNTEGATPKVDVFATTMALSENWRPNQAPGGQHFGLESTPATDSSAPLLSGSVGLWGAKGYVLVQDVAIEHNVENRQACVDTDNDQSTPAECDDTCGNFVCEPEHYEDCVTCSEDCVAPCGCGDSVCEDAEEMTTCEADCTLRTQEKRLNEWTENVNPESGTNVKYPGPICGIRMVVDGDIKKGGPNSPSISNDGGFSFTVLYLNFENEADPLEDRSGHRLDFQLPAAFNASDYWVAEGNCGNKIPPTPSPPARAHNCFDTSFDRPLTIAEPEALAGVFPHGTCPFTVMFWARVDGTTEGTAIGWGTNPLTTDAWHHRFDIRVRRITNTNSLIVNFGHYRYKTTGAYVNWGNNEWRHVAVFWHQQATTLKVYVNGVDANFASQRLDAQSYVFPQCTESTNKVENAPYLTHDDMVIGKFQGAIDEVSVDLYALEVKATFLQAVVNSNPLGGVSPAPPPTPWPTPFPPGLEPSQDPNNTETVLPPGITWCPVLTTCEDCLDMSYACHWCGADNVCREQLESCTLGEPSTEVCAASRTLKASLAAFIFAAMFLFAQLTFAAF